MFKVHLIFSIIFQLLLNPTDAGTKKNPIISSSGLVCEDNPLVAESGYSCSFLAKRFGGFLGCEKLLKDLSQDSLPPGIPGNTRVVDACPYSCNKCKECSFGCALWFIGNGVCDPECNNINCQFDGGDCWKVGCKLSSWSSWSSCSVTCGPGGRVTRTRQILVNPRNGGESCGALIAEETGCNSHIPCPLSCNVSEWGSWSKCSSSCGVGHQMRERSIIKAPKDQNLYQCPETRQIRECVQDSCTSDCVLGDFKFISMISANPCTDENGCVERREIISPPYKPLANYTCQVEERLINCNSINKNCIDACEFSEWSNWSSCSYFKDNDHQTKYKLMRKRRKESKRKIKNATCEDKIEYKECDNNDKLGVEALVRCNMGDWSSWSSCSTSCGLGSRLRARWLLSGPENEDALSESLLNTESVCGPLFQTKACNDRSCVTKVCKVSEWSHWSNCSSKTCNVPGLSKRYRSVISLPKKGDCPILEETRDCIGLCEQSLTISKSNCIFGDWSSWSSCEDECYTKRIKEKEDLKENNKKLKKYRHKMIVFNPIDKDCSKEKEYLESKECEEKCENSLIEMCQVTEWGPWSNCSASCDGGSRRRIRERINSQKNTGKNSIRPLTRGIVNNCPSLLEVEKCNTYPCMNNCELSPWRNKDLTNNDEKNIILSCSTKCGVGFVERVRSIINEDLDSFKFDEEYINRVCGPLNDKLKCLRVSENCNISCQVGEWGPWSACSVTCGEGFQSRKRELQIPSIGKKCELSTEEIRECYESSCPSSCLVSTWSEWSLCLGGCDEKPYRRRERMILEAPTYTLKCPHLVETKEESEDVCPMNERCPSDCQVTLWSQWSNCDVNCGIGVERRYRKIKSRESKGGSPCPDLEDYRPCSKKSCKSDCLLSEWGVWGTCSKTCGGGSRTRTRTIVSQPNEGRECGILKDFEPCNEFQCIATRDCEVGQWSAWSPCTATCGGGIKTREREIQVPATGGGRCDFDLSQKIGCNGFRCPGEPCIDRPEAQEVVPCSILKAMFGCQKRLIDVAKSNGVPYPEDKPTEARVMDGCPFTCGMCVECAPGCQLRDIGNFNCDPACNNADCRFDDGDCEENNISKVSCTLPKPPNGIQFILNDQILSQNTNMKANNTNIDSNIEREYKKGDIIYVKCEEGKRFRKYSAIPYFKYQCNESGFIQQLEPKGTPLLFVDGDGIPRIPSCEEDECPYVMIQEAPQLIGSVNTLYKRDTKHSYTYIMYRDIGEPIFITGDHQKIILGPVGTLYLISIDPFYPEYNDPLLEKYNLWSLVDIGEQKILQEFVELKPICIKDPNTFNKYNASGNSLQGNPMSIIKKDEIFNFNRPLRFLSQILPFDNYTETFKRTLIERPSTFIMGRTRYCEDQPEVKEQGISCETLSKMCDINIPNPQNYGLPENSFVWQICPGTCNKCQECSEGCPEWFKGNTVCDNACNNEACNYDDGDCEGFNQKEQEKQNNLSKPDNFENESNLNLKGITKTNNLNKNVSINNNLVIPQGSITYFAGKFRNCTDIPELIDSLASCKALKQTCQLKLPLSSSSLEAGLSHSSTISQVCPKTCGICEECSPGCPKWFVNNGYCDVNCQNPDCDFDGEDCLDKNNKVISSNNIGKLNEIDFSSNEKECLDNPIISDIFDEDCEQLKEMFGCNISLEKISDGLKFPEKVKPNSKLKDLCKLTCRNCSNKKNISSNISKKNNLEKKPFTFIMNQKRYCEDQPEVSKKGISCKTLSSMCNASIPGAKSYGLPESTPIWRICPATCNKCKECSEGCPEWFKGNTVCDEACNNEACNYDDGDCKNNQNEIENHIGNDEDLSYEVNHEGKIKNLDMKNSKTGSRIYSELDKKYFEILKANGEECKDDPKVEKLSGFTCEQITSVFDCSTLLTELPGSTIPDDIPKDTLLRHACAESCGLCNHFIKDKNSAIEYTNHLCKDDVFISFVTGKCRDIMNFSINLNEVCNESLSERTTLRNSRKSSFNMNKKVYDHCPKSCGRCRSECDDDSRLQPGECRVAIETANIQGYGCDIPLLQVSVSLAERFDDEKEYLLLSDVCARSCNYCTPNGLISSKNSNSFCSIKSTKHWGPGYQLELRSNNSGTSGNTGDRLIVSCSPGYSSPDLNESVDAICDIKSSVYTLPENFRCQEPHVEVMQVVLQIKEAADFDFTSVSSIYTALYSSLPIYQPNGLRIESISTREFDSLIKDNEEIKCEDQNHQLKSFGINCSMLKPFCSKTLEELAKQFNRNIPEGVNANIKVSLACPISCENCDEFMELVDSMKKDDLEEDDEMNNIGKQETSIGPLYILFDVGFFLSSSKGREATFEAALKDPKISQRFIASLKAQFASRGVRLAPKEFEQSRWDSQQGIVSNSRLASKDTENRLMKSKFKSARMIKILKSDWDKFYSGQKGVGMDEEARNLFYTSGISMPLIRSSRFGQKESVFLKRPLLNLQNSYLRCNNVNNNSKVFTNNLSHLSQSIKNKNSQYRDENNHCCNFPHEFRTILVNEGCGSLIYDREPDGIQMDLFCRGTSKAKNSCYQRFQDVILKYKHKDGIICNTVKYAQQLIDSWCFVSPKSQFEKPKSNKKYCFSSIKETIDIGMDSQDFVSAPFKIFQSRCEQEGCFRSHLKYFDAVTQLHTSWGYPLPNSPLKKYSSLEFNTNKPHVHQISSGNYHSNSEVLLEETNENWLDLLCTTTNNGVHCQESLSILLERNQIKSKTLLLNPCHSRCFITVAGKLGTSLQKFGRIAQDPQSESLGLLLRHYSRHFCVKNYKGQTCGPLLFAGASFALEASLIHKQVPSKQNFENENISNQHIVDDSDSLTGFQTQKTSSYCSTGCFSHYIGDGMCDLQCYNEACNWDKGDCHSSSMYPEIYVPLEDLFKGCVTNSASSSRSLPSIHPNSSKISNSCSSTCRARYSILAETLGCCTSVAVDLYQSLTQIGEKISVTSKTSVNPSWSISRLEQICGMSLDRTCSNGIPRTQKRILLGVNHPDSELADDPQVPLLLTGIISRSIQLLESDITKVFITSEPKTYTKKENKFLIDILIDTGSSETLDFDELLDFNFNKRRLEKIWSSDFCIELGDSRGEDCSVKIIEVTDEPIVTLGITNSTAPTLPWMNSIGFSFLNNDLPPEPCSLNHSYLQDIERYKVMFSVKQTNTKSFPHGSRLPISCSNNQYTASSGKSPDTLICNNGRWETLSNIKCNKRCNKLSNLSDGLRIIDPYEINNNLFINHGTKFEVECFSEQYKSTSHLVKDYVECIDGKWSIPKLNCKKSCTDLESGSLGISHIVTGTEFRHNDQRKVYCSDDHYLSPKSGNPKSNSSIPNIISTNISSIDTSRIGAGLGKDYFILTCNNGTWESEPLICVKGTLTDFSNIKRGIEVTMTHIFSLKTLIACIVIIGTIFIIIMVIWWIWILRYKQLTDMYDYDHYERIENARRILLQLSGIEHSNTIDQTTENSEIFNTNENHYSSWESLNNIPQSIDGSNFGNETLHNKKS